MPSPRTHRATLVHGKNRHATHYLGEAVPTPAGRLTPYRNGGYGDMAAALGQHIDPQPDGCWLWSGRPNVDGYGPYRTVWDILRGERIPRGHDLHHKCQVKLCVNPDHLEILTHADHIAHHADLRRSA